jgi:hypothetical protein
MVHFRFEYDIRRHSGVVRWNHQFELEYASFVLTLAHEDDSVPDQKVVELREDE